MVVVAVVVIVVFCLTEPFAFTGDHFGSSTGPPIIYSNVDCGGWENSIQECVKKSHFDIQCSHRAIAGVMCSDGIIIIT